MNNENNMDYQRIKHLVLDKKLSLRNLSEESLNTLIEIETENLMLSQVEYDMTFLDMCYDALKQYHDYDAVLSSERIQELSNTALSAYNKDVHLTEKSGRGCSRKKAIRILIAAAVIMTLLAGTLLAAWNPISEWFSDLYDLLKVERGSIFEGENSDLSVDNDPDVFESVAELEAYMGMQFDILHDIKIEPKTIQVIQEGNSVTGEYRCVRCKYAFSENEVLVQVYVENAPYREEFLMESNTEIYHINERKFYIMETENGCRALLFDEMFVYFISITDYDILMEFLKGIEQ